MCIGWLLDLILGVPETPEEAARRGMLHTPKAKERNPFDDTQWADYLDNMDQEEIEGIYDEEE